VHRGARGIRLSLALPAKFSIPAVCIEFFNQEGVVEKEQSLSRMEMLRTFYRSRHFFVFIENDFGCLPFLSFLEKCRFGRSVVRCQRVRAKIAASIGCNPTLILMVCVGAQWVTRFQARFVITLNETNFF
jgi:hypothetical protein